MNSRGETGLKILEVINYNNIIKILIYWYIELSLQQYCSKFRAKESYVYNFSAILYLDNVY